MCTNYTRTNENQNWIIKKLQDNYFFGEGWKVRNWKWNWEIFWPASLSPSLEWSCIWGLLKIWTLATISCFLFVFTSGSICRGIGSDTYEQPSIVAVVSHWLVLSGPMLFTIWFESTERLTAPHHLNTNKACLSRV